MIGEWYYENDFDINSKDSVYYENTMVFFLENGNYKYMKYGNWILDSLTHWTVSNDIFFMGDGRAGNIVNGHVQRADNARWQGKISQEDTIQGWFEVYTPPLKTSFTLIRKNKTN